MFAQASAATIAATRTPALPASVRTNERSGAVTSRFQTVVRPSEPDGAVSATAGKPMSGGSCPPDINRLSGMKVAPAADQPDERADGKCGEPSQYRRKGQRRGQQQASGQPDQRDRPVRGALLRAERER